MDLVAMLKSAIPASVIDKLAAMLGIDPDTARKGLGAGLPGLLAGLTGLASTPDGARRLDAAVEAADEDAFTDPARSVSRAAADASGDAGGGGILGSLLGNNTFSSLAGALSKFTGVGGGKMTALLGALAPMVLGFLKNQKRTMGLDAQGLAGMLSSQKQNIVNAMPSGLGSMLGNVPGLSSLTGAASSAAGSVGSAVNTAYDRGSELADDAAYGARRAVAAGQAAAPSAARWAIPLLALIALGGLVWWMVARDRGTQGPTATNPPSAAAQRAADASRDASRDAAAGARSAADRTAVAAGDAAAGAGDATRDAANRVANAGAEAAGDARAAGARVTADAGDAASAAGASVTEQVAGITKKLGTWTSGLTESLNGITDEASATAAIPKLQDYAKQLGSVGSMTNALPESARGQIVALVEKSKPGLNKALERVTALPGVGERIRPVATEIRAQMEKIAPSRPAPAGAAVSPAPPVTD
jgi:hypothetical protein